MKKFFSNKLNVILSIVLVAVIGLGIWFCLTIFGNPFSKTVNAIDFSIMNKEEVEKWISDSGLDSSLYNYSYQYDETIEKDYVVYQSVKEGEEITSSLTIVYSNGKDPNGTSDIATQIKNLSYADIKQWFILNEYSNVTYTFETNDTYEFGKVISVTPSNATKSDAIIVTLSYGKSVEDIETTVPDFSSYTKDEIEDWANEYSIILKFNYESSDLAKEDEYLSQSVKAGSSIKGGSNLIITLSSGGSSANTATIPDTLLGKSESDFKAELKKLGFKNLSKDDTTYFAEGLAEGTIYSYDDGTFNTSKTINYALSAGKYKFDAEDFNKKTKTEAEKVFNYIKNRNARVNGKSITIDFVNGDKDADKAGTVYDCSITDNKISCKLYTSDSSTTALIPTDGRYLGVKEGYFLSDLQSLGYTNFKKSNITYYSATLPKDTVWSYDDGQIATSKTINYALSAGAFEFEATEFRNLTSEEAVSKVKDLQNRNARINGTLVSISFTKGEVNDEKPGQTYGCTISKNAIACKLYVSSSDSGSTGKKATIPDTWLGLSESSFLNKAKALGFTNFSKSSTTYYSETMGSGTVWSYDDGTFDTSTTINYALCVGPYTFNASDYNGLSRDTAQSKVDNQKSRNAARGNLKITFINGDSSSSNAGNTYGCSYSSSTITCYLYTDGSSSSGVEVSNFAGADQGNFINWCDSNGLQYSIETQYSDGVEKDRVISQSPASGTVEKGTIIYAVVSKGSKPSDSATVMSISTLRSYFNGDSFNEIRDKVSDYFFGLGFTDVSFNDVALDGFYVSEVYIGNQKLSGQASYDTTNPVTVYIAYPSN